MNNFNRRRATCCLALLAPFFLVFASPAVHADIYRYEDEAGRVVYTNVPPKGKKNKTMRVVTEQISVIPGLNSRSGGGVMLPAPSEVSGRKSSASRAPTPESLAGLPSQIDNATQQGRDSTRRSILLDELNTEVKALTEARKQLQTTAQPHLKTASSLPTQTASATSTELPDASNPATAPINQTIQSHERNINALQKELGLR